jgi:hypothetical protein
MSPMRLKAEDATAAAQASVTPARREVSAIQPISGISSRIAARIASVISIRLPRSSTALTVSAILSSLVGRRTPARCLVPAFGGAG